MSRETRNDDKSPASPPRAGPRRSGLRFVVVFLALVGCFYIFSQLGVFLHVIAPGSIRASALASAPIIRVLGEDITVRGTMLASPKGQVDVHYGCDALEPIVYFSAAIIAFPASWRRRLIGLAIGVPALFVLNIARIVSLYFVATRRPEWFDAAHLDIWQPLFIVATLALWFTWVMLLPKARSPGATPSPRRPLTVRAESARALLAAVIYVAVMQAFSVADRPIASGIAAVSDVLLFRPGFGVRAHFETQEAPRGTELLVRLDHPDSGLAATNRLDLRFRSWLPMAVYLALVAVTPASLRRRAAALGIGMLALGCLTLLSAWLVALYAVILAPENMLGLGTVSRVAFNVTYSVFVLSNPAAALIPVLIWGFTMRRSLAQVFMELRASNPA